MNNDNMMLLIVGPSGGGKSSIIKGLIEKDSKKYCRIPSYTTRSPREGEKDGEEHNFISKEEYMELYKNKKLLACSLVNGYNYGMPKIDTSKGAYENRVILIDVGAKGAFELKKEYDRAIPIFITPPSVEKLMEQMRGRGMARLNRNKNQIKLVKEVCDWIIINDSVDDSITQIEKIVEILKVFRKNPNDISNEEAKYLYERNLYNEKNIKFLDEFYDKEEVQTL